MPVAFREGLQAAVFFTGQVVINNCDIVVVKHFFPIGLRGIFTPLRSLWLAAVVFAFSCAFVSAGFPIVAKRKDRRIARTTVFSDLSGSVVAFGLCLFVSLVLRPTPLA